MWRLLGCEWEEKFKIESLSAVKIIFGSRIWFYREIIFNEISNGSSAADWLTDWLFTHQLLYWMVMGRMEGTKRRVFCRITLLVQWTVTTPSWRNQVLSRGYLLLLGPFFAFRRGLLSWTSIADTRLRRRWCGWVAAFEKRLQYKFYP